MPEPGRTILNYRIVEKIGEGGMGVVWRATDTTLGRDVAIKVLPAALADDAERMARFEREARLLASLNHPHIATVHGLHEHEGERFLAMELVEGEELTATIERGLTVERVVEIAGEIALALEAAHQSGVVHRDLKPANVRFTAEGTVKVLDFGLAKAVAAGAASGSGPVNPTLSPTITSAGTMAGMVIGTAAYMSPEQARGKQVDRRADLWAFGCIVYEMLTGHRAFEGETISDTLASVLKESPDWSRLPADVPPALRRLLRRCLEKDPRQRLGDAGAARLELRDAFAEPAGPTGESAAPPAPPAPSRTLLPWLVAGVAILAALGGWLVRPGPEPAETLRLTVTLPDGVRFDDDQAQSLALAPDGRSLVFVGLDDTSGASLYLRRLGTLDAAPMPGTEGAENPFFSPDGRWVGFFADGALKKIAVDGGPPVEVSEGTGSARGAVWLPGDRIVFPANFDGPLVQVPAGGGAPRALTELDDERGERTHRWPSAVDDRGIVLFTVGTRDSPEDYEDSVIDAVRLDTGERTTVFRGASFARWLPTGHLLFGRAGTLWTVGLDLDSLTTTGVPRPVVHGVAGTRISGVVFADVSSTGLLAYVTGTSESVVSNLVWRYFDGRREPFAGLPPERYLGVEFSPDRTRLAVSASRAGTFDIYVYDLVRTTLTRLTFEGDNTRPVWTRDGRSILFSSVRDGLGSVWIVPADGSGTERQLYGIDGNTTVLDDVSADGKLAAVVTVSGSEGPGLVALPLDGTGTDTELATIVPDAEYVDNARYSPDGRWIAYIGSESNSFELMVRPASGRGGRWQVSQGGGVQPRWSDDGSKLFYRAARSLYVVDVDTTTDDGVFRSGLPRLVLEDIGRARLSGDYEISADADAILLAEYPVDESTPTRIAVVTDWFDELRRTGDDGR